MRRPRAVSEPGRSGRPRSQRFAASGERRPTSREQPGAWSTGSERPGSRISTALVALSGDRLGDGASGSLGAADLLRQLVFLPHATVLVAERRARHRGWRRPRDPTVGSRRRLRRNHRPARRRPDERTGRRERQPHRGMPQIGGQQGMCVGRGAAAGRPGRTCAMAAPGVRRRTAGPPAVGRPRRAPAR